MTWEEAVKRARETPDMAALVRMCYYDDPIEAAAARFKASEEWPAILSLLRPEPGAKVLELGAGRGFISWAFASIGCEVVAVEPDPSRVVGAGAIRELCAATGQRVCIVETKGEKIPFDANSFDYVVCRGVLHHVEKLPWTVLEAFRVLVPGGKFLAIKEPVAENPDELKAFLDEHPLQHLYGGEHAYPLRDYIWAFRNAGFRMLHNFGQFDHTISSFPLITNEAMREKAEAALVKRMPASFAVRLAERNAVLDLYRRWLTFRCRVPGRLHSFLAEKPT